MGEELPEGTVTILFTDVEGSTALGAQKGDEEARRILGAHEQAVRREVERYGGHEVKALGDGFMVAFLSARRALGCAVAIQRELAERSATFSGHTLRVRMGLNTGDVLKEANDLHGQAVNVAARIAQRARGGEILVSDVVKHLAGSVSELSFVDRGRHRLKGIPDRFHLFQVAWQATPRVSPPPRGTPLVGREPELTLLRACLGDALSGHSSVLLLTGEPGIGKTRLADALSAEAKEKGVRVTWGRCWESGGAPVFWPWVQIMRALVRGVSPDVLASQMGSGAMHLAQLSAEVRDLLPDLPSFPLMDPDQARFALFDAVSGFLRNVAVATPLLLVLDDLHGADVPTLLLLRFLAREPRDGRLLLVGTYRTIDASPAPGVADLLAALQREAQCMALRGLSQADIGTLVEQAAGAPPEPDLITTLHEATGGNPLYLEGVVRELAAQGRLADRGLDLVGFRIPDGLRTTILRRVQHLGDDTRRALGVAALIGREFTLLFLTHLCGLPVARVLDAMREATEAGFLVEVPSEIGRYAFSHGLVRDALAAGFSASELLHFHQLIGEALEALHETDRDLHVAELARHFLAAAPVSGWDKAIDYSVQAGHRALRLLAYEEAAEHYRRAVGALESSRDGDERRRAQMLLWLGDAELRSGQRLGARLTFERAADLARTQGWAEGLARAALGHAQTAEFAHLDEQPIALLEESVRRLPAEQTSLLAEIQARLAILLMPDPSAEGRRDELSRQAVENARAAGEPPLLAFALNARLHATWGPDAIDERLRTGDEILALAEEAEDLERRLEGHHWRLSAFLDLGDMAHAGTEIEAYVRVARKLKRSQYLVWALNRQKMLALLAGRFSEGEALAHEVYEHARRAEDPQAEFTLRVGLLVPREEQGRFDELAAALPDFVEDARRLHTLSFLRALVAHLLIVLRREAEARAAFEAMAVNGFHDIRRDLVWLPTLAYLSEVAAYLDDAARAAALYELLLPYEQRNVMASAGLCLGAAARYLGIAAGVTGHGDEACGHFEVALDLNARMGARPWLAHTQHDYARVLLTRGGPGDATRAAELLGCAAGVADELGMTVLAARVEALKGEAGGPPDPSPAVEAVFRREGEYWSVVFDGRTSRLKDTKGMRYLCRLIAQPEVEIHVLDLVASEVPGPIPTRLPPSGDASRKGERGWEVLDARAKTAYRQRIEELRDEVAEATSWNDHERAARAQEELELLTDELGRAVGLFGRDRTSSSASERARVSVTRAIRAAISRLADANPALARHFDNSVRTGTFCSYVPEPFAPVSWTL